MRYLHCVRYCFILTCLAVIPGHGHAKEYLYIHNTYSGEISKIAIPEHEVVATIDIGFYMDYVNKSPDNLTLYVNRIIGDLPGARARNVGESAELIAIDTRTDKEKWRMELDGMTHHMSVSKDGNYVYIPYYDSWWLAVVEVEKREVIKKIWIGNGGHGTGPVNPNWKPLLMLKSRQSRREERGLVRPNERRATQSDGFLASTRRAGALFPPSFVVSRLCSPTTPHSFRLAGRKKRLQQWFPIRVNRP